MYDLCICNGQISSGVYLKSNTVLFINKDREANTDDGRQEIIAARVKR